MQISKGRNVKLRKILAPQKNKSKTLTMIQILKAKKNKKAVNMKNSFSQLKAPTSL